MELASCIACLTRSAPHEICGGGSALSYVSGAWPPPTKLCERVSAGDKGSEFSVIFSQMGFSSVGLRESPAREAAQPPRQRRRLLHLWSLGGSGSAGAEPQWREALQHPPRHHSARHAAERPLRAVGGATAAVWRRALRGDMAGHRGRRVVGLVILGVCVGRGAEKGAEAAEEVLRWGAGYGGAGDTVGGAVAPCMG